MEEKNNFIASTVSSLALNMLVNTALHLTFKSAAAPAKALLSTALARNKGIVRSTASGINKLRKSYNKLNAYTKGELTNELISVPATMITQRMTLEREDRDSALTAFRDGVIGSLVFRGVGKYAKKAYNNIPNTRVYKYVDNALGQSVRQSLSKFTVNALLYSELAEEAINRSVSSKTKKGFLDYFKTETLTESLEKAFSAIKTIDKIRSIGGHNERVKYLNRIHVDSVLPSTSIIDKSEVMAHIHTGFEARKYDTTHTNNKLGRLHRAIFGQDDTSNNFQYYTGFDTIGGGIGTLLSTPFGNIGQMAGIPLTKILGLDKLTNPNVRTTNVTVLHSGQMLHTGSKIHSGYIDELSTLKADSERARDIFSNILGYKDAKSVDGELLTQFMSANFNDGDTNLLKGGTMIIPKGQSWITTNTGIYDAKTGTKLFGIGAFSGKEEDIGKFITVGIHDKTSHIATSMVKHIHEYDDGITSDTTEMMSLTDNKVKGFLGKLISMSDPDRNKYGQQIKEMIDQQEMNKTIRDFSDNKQISLELTHELLQDPKVVKILQDAGYGDHFINKEAYYALDTIEEQMAMLNSQYTNVSSGSFGTSKSKAAIEKIPTSKHNKVGSYNLSDTDTYNAIIFREILTDVDVLPTLANSLDDKYKKHVLAISGARYLENQPHISGILESSVVNVSADGAFNTYTVDLNNEVLLKKIRVADNSRSTFSTRIDTLDPESFQSLVDTSEFISINGYNHNGTLHGLDMDLNDDSYADMFTSLKAMNVGMMASVNSLASNFGLGIEFDIHDSPIAYATKLAANSALIFGALGLGLTAVDAGMKLLGEGTAAEDGLVPFVTAVASDALLASRQIADMTGLSTAMAGINNLIPGLISSPIGAIGLTAAPILAGLNYGNASGNHLIGLAAGGLGAMVLGGGGASLFGSYDLAKDSDDFYNEIVGNNDVAFRNARFWALNDSSFLGTNVNYFGRGGFAKNMTNGYRTANIGYDHFNGGHELSRPYATNQTVQSINQHGGLSMSGESRYEVGSDILGLRGFAFKSITKSGLNSDMLAGAPTLANSDDAYSVSRKFQNAQLGGGLGQTEFFRRVLQSGKNTSSKNIVNPLRNLMPDWMPGSNYMYNFKEGDPYTLISDGEFRLPGTGHLSNAKPKMNLPFDLNLMGFASKEEYISNVAHGGLSKNSVMKLTNVIKDSHIQMIKESTGLDPVINQSYYGGNNIIANSDYELNGTAFKIEVVDSEQFAIGQETGRFKRRADLLATISEKPAVLIIVNGETNQQMEIQGEYNPELLKSEVKKLNSMKDDLFSAMGETGIGFAHAYSIVDRFLILADTSPYSNEFKNYRLIVSRMMDNNELDKSEVRKVAKALRQSEVVTSGIQTGTEKQVLSQFLPNKLIHPDYIDPLDSYIHTQKLSSGMKQWDNPIEYFEDDFKSAISGDMSGTKQFIGSMGLYGFIMGPERAFGVAGLMSGIATATNVTGGVHFSDKYDKGRDILRQQDALNYARGEASFMEAVSSGETNIRKLIAKLPKGDKQTAVALSQVRDKNYQDEILEKISDPHLKYVLAKAYGVEHSGNDILNEGYDYIATLDQESALFDEGVDTDYFVIKSALEMGVNPKQLGKGFDIQEYERRTSAYANMSLTSSTVKSIEHRLRNKLSFLGKNVSIEVSEYSDNNHIDVIIYE